MRFIRALLILWCLAGGAHLGGLGQVHAAQSPLRAAEAAAGEKEEHGVPQKAQEIAKPFGFPITNSMLVSWVAALGLIIFARVAMKNVKDIPSGAQNFWEW